MFRQKVALSLAVVVLGLAGPALSVSPPHAARPNISMDVGNRHSVIVYLVNMTKYQMTLASDGDSAFAVPTIQQNVQSYDTPGFVFAPSGLPAAIPPVKGGYSDPTKEVYCSAKPFVFVWQDAGSSKSVKPEVVLKYTLANVEAPGSTITDSCGNSGQAANVNIHIEFDRVKTGPPPLKSEIFEAVVTGVKAIVELGEFVVEGNPIAFVMFLDETYNFVKEVSTINAEKGDSSDTAYFNSYALACNGDADKTPSFITHPAVGAENDPQQDGVATQQGDLNGNPASNLVVAQYLLRESNPSDGTFNGRLPILSVIVMTKQDWAAGQVASATTTMTQTSKAGAQISSQLMREGLSGRRNLLQLVRSLPAKDVQALALAYRDMRARKKPSEAQELLVQKLADAFAKHASSIPANPPSKS